MKPAERDELLVRMDERIKNIDVKTGRQEAHLEAINGHLENHSKRLTIVETLQRERNTPSKKNIGVITSVMVAVVVALWRAFTV